MHGCVWVVFLFSFFMGVGIDIRRTNMASLCRVLFILEVRMF